MLDYRKDQYQPYVRLYFKVWKIFDEELIKYPLKEAIPNHNELLFADFRGLVVCRKKSPNHFFNDFLIQGKMLSPERNREPRVFGGDESVKLAYTVLPFMTSEASEEADNEKDKKELTVTRFLDGRAIYASTLGAQPAKSLVEEFGKPPLTYFVLTTDINSWQVGRLVDRLHALGTVRLAALRDVELLKTAGKQLYELEQGKMEGISRDFDTLAKSVEKDAEGAKGAERAKGADAILKNLSEAAENLRAIREITKKSSLPYRVERSRYYSAQFKNLLRALRIAPHGRIEGFETYDELIERRFGSAFNFIDMVGTRYNRIENMLSAMNQRLRTFETSRLMKNTAEQTGRIEEFQAAAEAGFLLALFPYYTTYLVVHFILGDKWIDSHGPWPGRAIAGFFLYAGCCIWLSRRRGEPEEISDDQRRSLNTYSSTHSSDHRR